MFSALLLALAVTGQSSSYDLINTRAQTAPKTKPKVKVVSALDEARAQVRTHSQALVAARERVRYLSPEAPTITEANPRYQSTQRSYLSGSRYPTAEPGPPPGSEVRGPVYASAQSPPVAIATPIQFAQGGSCYSGAPAQAYSAAPPTQYAQGGSCYSGSAQAYSAAPQYSTGGSCYSGSPSQYSAAPYSSPMVSAPQMTYGSPQFTYSAPRATYSSPWMTVGTPQVTYGAPVQTYASPVSYGASMSYGAPMSSYGSMPIASPIGGSFFGGMSSGGMTCLSGTCQ
jgi:hypothetical protein